MPLFVSCLVFVSLVAASTDHCSPASLPAIDLEALNFEFQMMASLFLRARSQPLAVALCARRSHALAMRPLCMCVITDARGPLMKCMIFGGSPVVPVAGSCCVRSYAERRVLAENRLINMSG